MKCTCLQKSRLTKTIGGFILRVSSTILRDVENPITKQQTDTTPVNKNTERREKFRKIGEAISKIGDPDVRDYRTGGRSEFELKRFDALNRDADDPLNLDGRDHPEVPLGPRFNTPQWERSIRK